MTIDAMFTQFPRLKFYLLDEGFHRAETGYELNRAFWRQGMMTGDVGYYHLCVY